MFKINGERWRVHFVQYDHPCLLRSDGSYTIGACDDNSKMIYINENLTGFMLKKVLCHEVTHAAMFSYNVALSLDLEELIADIIATYGEEIINITNTFFGIILRAS